MIKSLPFEDQRCLEAAQGWFELGNHLEANEELENITAENRAHPAQKGSGHYVSRGTPGMIFRYCPD